MLQAPLPTPFAEKMLTIAEKYQDSPATLDALLWGTKNTPSAPSSKSEILAKMHELLLAHHLQDPRIGELAVFSESAFRQREIVGEC